MSPLTTRHVGPSRIAAPDAPGKRGRPRKVVEAALASEATPEVAPEKVAVQAPARPAPNALVSREAERILAARRSPNAFISYVFLDNRPQKWFHAQWQDLYTAHERLVLFCSLEHGKTEQLSAWRTLFEFGIDPEQRFLGISSKSGHMIKVGAQLIELIANPDKTGGRLHRVFPNLLPEDRRDHMQSWNSRAFIVRRELNSRDPSFEASGVKGTVIGGRKDKILLDDVMNWNNTVYKTERDRVVEWFQSSEVLGRVVAGGKVIFVNSPWHPEAVAHVAAEKLGFHAENFVACDEHMDNILWPLEESNGRIVGFDRRRLIQKRKEMGPVEFGRCFLGKPITSKTQWFDLGPMTECVDIGRKLELQNSLDVPGGLFPICGIDPAVGKSTSNDTVFFLMGLNLKTGRKRLCYLRVGKMGAIETFQEIVKIFRSVPNIIFWVESNAQQDFLLQILKTTELMQALKVPGDPVTEAEANMIAARVRPFNTDEHKSDPVSGIPAMQADFEAHTWELPDCYETELWFRQALEYRPGRKTGDILMASYFAWSKGNDMTTRRAVIPMFIRKAMDVNNDEQLGPRGEFAGILSREF